MHVQDSQQTRLQEEADFADKHFAAPVTDLAMNERLFAAYARPTRMWDWRQRAARLLGSLDRKELLDYGCGAGEEAIYFAKLGARVSAIDISPGCVEVTRNRAECNGVGERVNVNLMDATHTTFASNSFDLVHGLGILHHVGLAEGLTEVHRVLRPGGAAVFLEPLGSSAVVEGAKEKLHAKLGDKLDLAPVTTGERNLRLREVFKECSRFSHARVFPYRLTYRARKLFLPFALWNTSLRLDHTLLYVFPFLKHFAGAAVLHVRK